MREDFTVVARNILVLETKEEYEKANKEKLLPKLLRS